MPLLLEVLCILLESTYNRCEFCMRGGFAFLGYLIEEGTKPSAPHLSRLSQCITENDCGALEHLLAVVSRGAFRAELTKQFLNHFLCSWKNWVIFSPGAGPRVAGLVARAIGAFPEVFAAHSVEGMLHGAFSLLDVCFAGSIDAGLCDPGHKREHINYDQYVDPRALQTIRTVIESLVPLAKSHRQTAWSAGGDARVSNKTDRESISQTGAVGRRSRSENSFGKQDGGGKSFDEVVDPQDHFVESVLNYLCFLISRHQKVSSGGSRKDGAKRILIVRLSELLRCLFYYVLCLPGEGNDPHQISGDRTVRSDPLVRPAQAARMARVGLCAYLNDVYLMELVGEVLAPGNAVVRFWALKLTGLISSGLLMRNFFQNSHEKMCASHILLSTTEMPHLPKSLLGVTCTRSFSLSSAYWSGLWNILVGIREPASPLAFSMVCHALAVVDSSSAFQNFGLLRALPPLEVFSAWAWPVLVSEFCKAVVILEELATIRRSFPEVSEEHLKRVVFCVRHSELVIALLLRFLKELPAMHADIFWLPDYPWYTFCLKSFSLLDMCCRGDFVSLYDDAVTMGSAGSSHTKSFTLHRAARSLLNLLAMVSSKALFKVEGWAIVKDICDASIASLEQGSDTAKPVLCDLTTTIMFQLSGILCNLEQLSQNAPQITTQGITILSTSPLKALLEDFVTIVEPGDFTFLHERPFFSGSPDATGSLVLAANMFGFLTCLQETLLLHCPPSPNPPSPSEDVAVDMLADVMCLSAKHFSGLFDGDVEDEPIHDSVQYWNSCRHLSEHFSPLIHPLFSLDADGPGGDKRKRSISAKGVQRSSTLPDTIASKCGTATCNPNDRLRRTQTSVRVTARPQYHVGSFSTSGKMARAQLPKILHSVEMRFYLASLLRGSPPRGAQLEAIVKRMGYVLGSVRLPEGSQ
eukprot:CAMPEP_0119157660 /NCGR_PEP_ID=MMETSP1310-20130426/52869_1 /TAXON_ID=464262 /ORGANISM="Genus nov. species nov., Strain RCC2339" /LENGTH=920 /DNA_ID=CAMNT_0007150279 /DNA_START=27 /DNA_END=2786 /DNA_ORIENTATION=-